MNADTLAWTIARKIAEDPVMRVHASNSAMSGGASTLIHDRLMPIIEEAMREIRELRLRGQLMHDQYEDLDRATQAEIDRLTGALGEMTFARVAAERKLNRAEEVIQLCHEGYAALEAQLDEANSERLTDYAIEELALLIPAGRETVASIVKMIRAARGRTEPSAQSAECCTVRVSQAHYGQPCGPDVCSRPCGNVMPCADHATEHVAPCLDCGHSTPHAEPYGTNKICETIDCRCLAHRPGRPEHPQPERCGMPVATHNEYETASCDKLLPCEDHPRDAGVCTVANVPTCPVIVRRDNATTFQEHKFGALIASGPCGNVMPCAEHSATAEPNFETIEGHLLRTGHNYYVGRVCRRCCKQLYAETYVAQIRRPSGDPATTGTKERTS